MPRLARSALRTLLSAATATLVGLVGLTGCGGERDATDVPVGAEPVRLAVAGPPFEMGRRIGEALSGPIRAAVGRRLSATLGSVRDGGDAGFLLDVSRLYASQLRDRLPESVREELRGLAEGSGASEADLLLLNVVREGLRWHGEGPPLLGAAMASPPTTGSPPTGPASASGGGAGAEPLLAAAYEAFRADRLEGQLVWIERRPDGAAPTAVLCFAGSLGALCGVSERLAVVAGEYAVPVEATSLRSAPFGIGLRVALERATDLDDFWARLPRASGHRVLAVDRAGRRRVGVLAMAVDPAQDAAPEAWAGVAGPPIPEPDDPAVPSVVRAVLHARTAGAAGPVLALDAHGLLWFGADARGGAPIRLPFPASAGR